MSDVETPEESWATVDQNLRGKGSAGLQPFLYRVGDVIADPGRALAAFGKWCGQPSPDGQAECALTRGHDGPQHVAAAGDYAAVPDGFGVVAVWPVEPAPSGTT